MLKLSGARLNSGHWDDSPRSFVCPAERPVFSWALLSDEPGESQESFRIRITGGEFEFDSGFLQGAEQFYECTADLPREVPLAVSISVRGRNGTESEPLIRKLIIANFTGRDARWIAPPAESGSRALTFSKEFEINSPVKSAVLYICGIGHHSVKVNGRKPDRARLDPAYSDYTKSCYYIMLPQINDYLRPEMNRIEITVGQGWRNNKGVYFDEQAWGRSIKFMGELALTACLKLNFENGETSEIRTGEDWSVYTSPTVFTHLFDGETYDNRAGVELLGAAVTARPPVGELRLMTIEPVTENEIYPPVSILRLGEKRHLIDFGKNIAGVCRVKIPLMNRGECITITHAEELRPDGELFTDILRGAKATDCYISSGNEPQPAEWQPEFVYHGFRYAVVEGLRFLEKEDISAVSLYSNLRQTGSFASGSAILNQIHQTVINTEKANMHSILTDCPQRDERMGWMNDATVRYNELPYNFDAGRMFPKIIQDITDTQGEDGSITCTAPFVYGNRPADPVCSSFLIAGLESLLFYGNKKLIEKNFGGFEKWQVCLSANSDNYIVNYSHYGDWAGPVNSCINGENDIDAVQSRNVPGEFISTGFYYYNACLLEKFAALLGNSEKSEYYSVQKENIKAAILAKWWNNDSAIMVNGSQACQSFALWLGIIPENKQAEAAKIIHENLAANDYKIATGNLCTRYLLDALSENGYIDDAYRIMTNEKYPSLGYMLQNAATTVWERFELKNTPGMNSHNHPMYGSVDYWFYAYLAGIKITEPGCERVRIKPCFPSELSFVSASIDTVKGPLSVRWIKQFGSLTLFVSIPAGTQAEIIFDGGVSEVKSGFHKFSKNIETADQKYITKGDLK